LIERVRTEYDRRLALRVFLRVDHRLRQREQRFARAGHRQHLGDGVDGRQVVALRDPLCDRLAQRRGAERERIRCQTAERIDHGLFDQLGRRMLRLADPEADVRKAGGRRDVLEEQTQLFEGIRLKGVE
jgi:hypothetical protein